MLWGGGKSDPGRGWCKELKELSRSKEAGEFGVKRARGKVIKLLTLWYQHKHSKTYIEHIFLLHGSLPIACTSFTIKLLTYYFSVIYT
jgi:hypothetical protein